MVVVDTRVEYGDNDSGIALLDVPRLGRVEVGVPRPARLARVVQGPLREKFGSFGMSSTVRTKFGWAHSTLGSSL